MEAILLEDIYSNVKGNKQYGKKGDRVTIVSVRVNVLIVKNATESYPVSIEKVKMIEK
jgi:membrane protein implicated in regulation of membrane protease activity